MNEGTDDAPAPIHVTVIDSTLQSEVAVAPAGEVLLVVTNGGDHPEHVVLARAADEGHRSAPHRHTLPGCGRNRLRAPRGPGGTAHAPGNRAIRLFTDAGDLNYEAGTAIEIMVQPRAA